MATAAYWQRGEALDYENDGVEAIEAGTVVTIGGKVGIAASDIPAGETGVLHVSGVFRFTKTGTTEIAIGTAVYFDGTGITDTADGNAAAGFAACGAAADDTEILVKINA